MPGMRTIHSLVTVAIQITNNRRKNSTITIIKKINEKAKKKNSLIRKKTKEKKGQSHAYPSEHSAQPPLGLLAAVAFN
jgi:hypothetical protein